MSSNILRYKQGANRSYSASANTWGHIRMGYVSGRLEGGKQHLMAEKLAAYRRRAFLIRDRVKALGL